MPETPQPQGPTNIQALQGLYDATRVANLTAAQHDQLKLFGLQLMKFIESNEASKAAVVPPEPVDAGAPAPIPFPKG